MTAIEYLDQQIKAAIPRAQGVRIPRWAYQESWSISGDNLTAQDHATARAIFYTFNKATWEASNPEPTPAMRLIDQIKADPDALAALKAELAK